MDVFSTHSRRKFPRRRFHRGVGLLRAGVYDVGAGVEIGEGGLSLTLTHEIPADSHIVLSFQVPDSSFVTVRALVRDCREDGNGGFIVGCQFENISFEQKRQIRSYVSARTMLEV